MNYIKNYIEKLRDLENYLDFAIDVSDRTSGKKDISWRLVRAHQLYIRLTVACLSFIRLLPKNRYLKTNFDFWDFPSVANIARNFIETYHVFYYIGLDKVAKEEVELRLLIFNYHLNNEKYKLYKESGILSEDLREFEINLPKTKEMIRNHKAFSKIEKNKARRILKGIEFMCITHKEISDKIEFNTKEFRPMYRFLSNQIHSTPFSFFSQSNERGRGIENEPEVNHTILCIDFVTKYLLASIIGMVELFPDCQKTLDKIKLKIITEKLDNYMK